MLFINKKYKPIITKQAETKEKEQDYMPNIQGKGLNELIEKVKDMKVYNKMSSVSDHIQLMKSQEKQYDSVFNKRE